MFHENKNQIIERDQLLFFLFFCFSFIFFGIAINYGNDHKYTTYHNYTAAGGKEAENSSEATTAQTAAEETTEEDRPYIVVIDAGHGGNDTGAYYRAEEGKIHEKTVNLKIAKYLKKALEEYDNVEVLMTRTRDKYLYLDERTDYAIKHHADIFVSIHNNTLVGAGGMASGCSVAVAMGNYKEDVGLESQKLGVNIAHELEKIGLKNNGLLMRSSESYTYPNGRAADYYATIRNLMEYDIPSVIIEHAFIDNEDDFYDFLCSKKKLKKLAVRDAKAIARYLQIPRKDTGKIKKPMSNYRIRVCHIKKNGSAKRSYRYYYTDD